MRWVNGLCNVGKIPRKEIVGSRHDLDGCCVVMSLDMQPALLPQLRVTGSPVDAMQCSGNWFGDYPT